MRKVDCVLFITLILVWAGGYSNAETVNIETNSNFRLQWNLSNYNSTENCEGHITDGRTFVKPIEYFSSANDAMFDVYDALGKQYAHDEINDLYFEYEVVPNHLMGTMTVDWYKAFDRESGADCLHGAEIVAWYDYPEIGPDEVPLNLTWIQIYHELYGSAHSSFPYMVDGSGDENPAYYVAGATPWIPDGYTLPGNHDLVWSDSPQDPHPESKDWFGEADFYVMLAGFSAPYTRDDRQYVKVSLYDGVKWGYDGSCYPNVNVPEPTTATLLCFALISLVVHRKYE